MTHRMLLALAAAVTLLACASGSRHLLDAEVGDTIYQHTTVPCNVTAVGSVAGCYDQSVKAIGNNDFKFMASPYTTYPTDGTPWGVSIGGPYPDGVSYRISWNTMGPTTGPSATLVPNPNPPPAYVRIATYKGGAMNSTSQYLGSAIQYVRAYLPSTNLNYLSYMSPYLNHVVLANLTPKTTYYYVVGNGTTWSGEFNFTTLATAQQGSMYPLRVGLIADVGQTVNSSYTMQHLVSSQPDVTILVADNSYADDFGANSFDNSANSGNGTNQNKWDTYAVMWQPAFSSAPLLNCAGNHELETTGNGAVINYTTTSFSCPTNCAFQAYSARYPVPGVTKNWGIDININLYYSTIVGGIIKLITLNNYIPFYEGTPQYQWALAEFANFDRSVTPWLFVQFHAPPYHTYYTHYKEQECFMSIYEDIFYQYGVDLVLNGHVHAYERTHPMYKYQVDTCGPVYITIGDGGNVEGPYRNFVDQVDPNTNMTYCAMLAYSGKSPNQIQAAGASWGPSYQTQAQPPSCVTTSWQPASGVAGGPPLVLLNGSSTLGFCQSSQPLWSAYRDPSFGHGILEVTSPSVMTMSWYRNIDNQKQIADQVTLERLDGCANRAMGGMPARKRAAERKMA